MLQFVKKGIRRSLVTARWLLLDVPKAPGLEFYALRQDHLNRKTLQQIRLDRVGGRDVFLEPYYPQQIPKIIWMYWGQGADAVPYIVRRCIESWQQHNPGWELRILDDISFADRVDMSDFPDFLPRRLFANLLRTRLLKKYGGIWADATVYCHRPLDDWLPLVAMTGYFTLDRPGPDRALSSWFIASVPEHEAMCAWEEAYGAYLRSLTRMHRKYFMFFYSFQWRLKRDPAAMSAFLRKGGLQAPPTFLLMSSLQGYTPVSVVHQAVACGLPFSKLSWKESIPDKNIDQSLAALPVVTPIPDSQL